MKRVLLALLLGLLGATSIAAVCTPVKVSEVYTTKDDGLGGVDNVTFGNWHFSFTPSFPSTTITVAPGTWHFNSLVSGWADVPGGFGGCTVTSWTYVASHSFTLHDMTANSTVNYDSAFVEHTCNNSPSCSFEFPDPVTGKLQATLTAGHTYQLLCHHEAAIFGIGASPLYAYILTIKVD